MQIKNTDIGLTVIFMALISIFALVTASLTLNPPKKTITKEKVIVKKGEDQVVIKKGKDKVVYEEDEVNYITKKKADKIVEVKGEDKVVWKDSEPIIKIVSKKLEGRVFNAPNRGNKKGAVVTCESDGLRFEDGRGFVPHQNERSEAMKLKDLLKSDEYLALLLYPDGSAKKCSVPLLMNMNKANVDYALFPIY